MDKMKFTNDPIQLARMTGTAIMVDLKVFFRKNSVIINSSFFLTFVSQH